MSETRRELETGRVTRRVASARLLHDFFERQVEARPDHVAVEFQNEALTYRDLERRSNRFARVLVARGVVPGNLVGLYLNKSSRLFVAMLGILKAGAGYVPIDPRFPVERIRTILEDSGAKVIVTEAPLAHNIEDAAGTLVLRLDRDRDEIDAQPDEPVTCSEELPSSTLCYVIYTSGSTGRPKGVMIEHRNAVAFVENLDGSYGVREDDRVYQGFSTAFDASVEEIWAAFSRGGTLVVPTEEVARSPGDVADFVCERKITYFSTVPTMLSMIDRDLPSVRTLVLGGEACPAELVARWAKPTCRMINTYGPTETTVVATWSDCVPGQPVKIGIPLPGYTAHVLDDALAPVSPGGSGELYVGGRGVARGYMNLEQLTRERFIPDPFGSDGGRLYRTFDHVRLGEDGQLYFLGRLDDQVKIRGFRVELSEIEALLLQHRGIKAAAVRVVETAEMKELAASVVCDPADGVTLDRKDLAEFLRARMPPYMIPKYLDILPDLPVTTSGKIDRRALPPPERLFTDDGVLVPPANELERVILDVWLEAFGLPQISVEADFFSDLGGHSYLAAKTVTLLRRATGFGQLSVRDVYDCRTIRTLAEHVRVRLREAGAALPSSGSDTGTHDETPPSLAAFRETSPLVRWTTVTIQALVAMAFYGVIAAPLAFATLLITSVVDGRLDWVDAAWIATVAGFAVWPSMLLLSIAVKWLVIGRYRPGRYPVWGFYYLRWWIANRFQELAWAEIFRGTPLMSLYWRSMGAKVGRNVTIATSHCCAFDVVSIGDDTSIGLETQILGYSVEDGYLVIAPTVIGKNCFVGMHCAIGLDTRMGDGARLDDLSLLAGGMEMEPGETRRGSPAEPADVDVPVPPPETSLATPRRRRIARVMFGLAHLAIIYVMGYFLIAVSIPSAALLIGALYYQGPYWAIAAGFAAVPVWLLSYILGTIVLRLAIGYLKAGRFPLHSAGYLRHWFSAYLLENTKNILMPVYATVYLPSLFRALGARIGRGVEISTVSHICPDLLEIGEGSFMADACLVGGMRIHDGIAEFGAVQIGSKSFIGNSALVPGGVSIGSGVLIGVSSAPPAGSPSVPDNTRWLGSPGFALPNTQKATCFEDTQIFAPTRGARIERAAIDAARILVPGLLGMACAMTFVAVLVIFARALPLHYVIAIVPPLAMALAFVSIALTALSKWLLAGKLTPVVRPLWSRFVWHNEFINGLFESAAAPAMAPLLGTPMIAPCLRLMGCKVGKWCFINTTLFSEFDLVRIGDRAALNLGATIQTHLFEDRVFKADYLRIGSDCSIGNMAVVLYTTEMESGSKLDALSVLMKGETLPPMTCWAGIPCAPTRSHVAATTGSLETELATQAGSGDEQSRFQSPTTSCELSGGCPRSGRDG